LSRKLHVPTVVHRERTLAPTDCETGWRPELVSEVEKKEKSYTSTGNCIPVPTAINLVAMDITLYVGRDNSVGIAIRYGLDGQWIESQWGRDLPQRFLPTLGSIVPPVKFVLPLFPAYKAAGVWCRPFTTI